MHVDPDVAAEAVLYVPAGHIRHIDDEAVLYVPAEHRPHIDDEAVLYFPAGHSSHAADPFTSLKLPAAQAPHPPPSMTV